MDADTAGSERRLFSRWLRGTFYGWVLGAVAGGALVWIRRAPRVTEAG